MAPRYDVFISHAGEDKFALAVLIYECLRRRGISAFLDKRELKVAGIAIKDMGEAMSTALIGLFILSPEFALKKYTMLELECFLRRAGLLQGEGGDESGADCPKLIPVFYRLPVAACKRTEEFEKIACDRAVRAGFDKVATTGKTSLEKVLGRLTILAKFTGVENEGGIGNDETNEMKRRREALTEEICDNVTEVLVEMVRSSSVFAAGTARVQPRLEGGLHPTFDVPRNPAEVILEFSGARGDGETPTVEAGVLREVLRNDDVCKTIALIGEGGVGKSCILREVARRKEVRERFPGGVFYISLGMDASVDTLRMELLRVLRASGGKQVAARLRDEDTIEEIFKEVGNLIGRGRSLVLLDDLWERNGIRANIVSGVCSMFSKEHGGMVLLTTRSASVAFSSDVPIHIEPREVVSELTRNILLKYAKFSMKEVEEEQLGWVVKELQEISAGIPVCLAVIGLGVGKLGVQLKAKRRRAWKVYWEKIKNNGAVLLRGKVDGYATLNASLSVALLVLEENEGTSTEDLRYSWSEMYGSLCVMKKPTVAPICALQRMWRMSDAGEVMTVVEGFSGVGLGEIVLEEDEIKGLKVHHLLHDFATSLAKDKERICEWHKTLLDGYISPTDDEVRAWWNLENDGYVYENVSRHLRGSGGSGELTGLLLTPQWTNARLKEGGYPAWKEDFSFCLEEREQDCENKDTVAKRSGLRLIRDAVADSWPFIAPNEREQLAFQMYGRLQEAKEWPARKYLDSVKEWQRGLWLKPDRECWSRPAKGIPGEIPMLRDGRPLAVALHGEPLCAVVGTEEGVVVVIDVEERRVVKRLVGHTGCVMQVAVRSDGIIYSYSWDGTIRSWDLETGAELQCTVLAGGFERSTIRISKLCNVVFNTESRVLLSGSEDGEVDIWDVDTGENVGSPMHGFQCAVRCVGVSPDGSRVVAGGEDGSLRMWKISTRAQLWDVPGGERGEVICVAFSPNGLFVAASSEEGTFDAWKGTLRILNAITGEQIGRSSVLQEDCISCMTCSGDSGRVLFGSRMGAIRVRDLEERDEVRVSILGKTLSEVKGITVSDDGKFAVSIDGDSVRIWDIQEPAEKRDEHFKENSLISYLACSPDKRLYLSVHDSSPPNQVNTVRVWDAESGKQIGEPLHMVEPITHSVAFSPDNRHFVYGTLDRTLKVWNIASLSQVGSELHGHTGWLNSIAFSPNGQWIASGSDDTTARLWRVEGAQQVDTSGGGTWRALMKLLRRSNETETTLYVETENEKTLEHDREVSCVAFSADGNRLICGLANGKMHVWETASGKFVGSANAEHGSVVKRIDRLEIDYFRSLDQFGQEMKWRLEGEGGLTCISEMGGDGSPAGYAEGIKARPTSGDVYCYDRIVRLGEGGPVIATLPSNVADNGWKYDSSRGTLVTGLFDGQVLFSRFVS